MTKIGLSYSFLQAKAQEFFDNLLDEEKGGRKFKASNGWLSKVLKRNGLSSHAIHGEGGEMDEKQQQENIKQMQDKIQDLTDKYNIPASQIYNADQTGLFYNKLPNQTYLKKDQAKHARGTKQMKSKDQVTIMITTSADGSKCPLYVVGKSAMPEAVRILNN